MNVTRITAQSAVGIFSVLTVAVSMLLGPASASAGLIVDSVRYDGQVREGGVTGTEAHFTSDTFPPPGTMIDLPATGDPPAPLDAANDLRMSFNTTIQEVGGVLYDTGILTISNPTGIDIFANALDTTLPHPVEFETYLYLDDLAADQRLALASIGVENNNTPPFGDAGAISISDDRGSADDPIHVQLGLSADQLSLRNGYVKLHFRYAAVPEPAAWALIGLGLATATACRRGRVAVPGA